LRYRVFKFSQRYRKSNPGFSTRLDRLVDTQAVPADPGIEMSALRSWIAFVTKIRDQDRAAPSLLQCLPEKKSL
jgi:hypothetical protein